VEGSIVLVCSQLVHSSIYSPEGGGSKLPKVSAELFYRNRVFDIDGFRQADRIAYDLKSGKHHTAIGGV
jgi:hypothetical protein